MWASVLCVTSEIGEVIAKSTHNVQQSLQIIAPVWNKRLEGLGGRTGQLRIRSADWGGGTIVEQSMEQEVKGIRKTGY